MPVYDAAADRRPRDTLLGLLDPTVLTGIRLDSGEVGAVSWGAAPSLLGRATL